MHRRQGGQRVLISVMAMGMVAAGWRSAACQQTTIKPPSTGQGSAPPPSNSTAETHLAQGYDALKQDRYTVAVEEFRAALNLDPNLVLRARFPLAVALFEMHNYKDARQELEQVRRAVGDHPNVMYYLGRLDVEEHNFEAAIRELSIAAEKPPFPDTSYYLGYAYFKQGDLAEAEGWLKKAEVAIPHDSRVPYQLGFLYRQKGLQAESGKAFAQAAQLRQRDADEARLQGECVQKLDQGQREQARAVCNQLYDNNDAERLTELGTLYGQHGDYEAALKPLQRAAELTPQSPQMQYNLSLVYFQLNRFAEARAPLQKALQRWPDLFQLNALYGAVLLKLNDERAAYQTLRHAHELNPSDAEATNLLYLATVTLAKKFQDTRQYSESLHYYAEAARLKPGEPAPHRGMAKIYGLTGKKSQAQVEEEAADRLAKGLNERRPAQQ
ncbi:MAG TPA: tetratricopeptide repeat protein [Terriglobales bacterium]|nr:tetratricopeptide repeat protein [Terriglobales bacterium]